MDQTYNILSKALKIKGFMSEDLGNFHSFDGKFLLK